MTRARSRPAAGAPGRRRRPRAPAPLSPAPGPRPAPRRRRGRAASFLRRGTRSGGSARRAGCAAPRARPRGRRGRAPSRAWSSACRGRPAAQRGGARGWRGPREGRSGGGRAERPLVEGRTAREQMCPRRRGAGPPAAGAAPRGMGAPLWGGGTGAQAALGGIILRRGAGSTGRSRRPPCNATRESPPSIPGAASSRHGSGASAPRVSAAPCRCKRLAWRWNEPIEYWGSGAGVAPAGGRPGGTRRRRTCRRSGHRVMGRAWGRARRGRGIPGPPAAPHPAAATRRTDPTAPGPPPPSRRATPGRPAAWGSGA
jgi:hypothetical protein